MVMIEMKMPKNCRDCPMMQAYFCVLHDGIPAHDVDEEKRPDWCPLIESDTDAAAED